MTLSRLVAWGVEGGVVDLTDDLVKVVGVPGEGRV